VKLIAHSSLIALFVETPRKFITAKLSIRKPGSSSVLIIENFAVINLRGVSTNKTIICFIAMQTYKELITFIFVHISFFLDDVKTHRLICFSNDQVRLSDLARTKLGPVIIYQDNDTELICPTENNPYPPPDYRCNVKPDMNQSSEAFTTVNFTNALYIDNEMFLRVSIPVSEEVSGMDKLVLHLFCWDPDRLFSFVKGRIEIALTHEALCEEDHQPRNNSLCSNTKSCPEDTLCSKVINAAPRCVPSDDQLFVIIPRIRDGELLCKFESCLQEMLVNSTTGCLSDWNGRYWESGFNFIT
jgi:hypothetical protein